MDEFETIWKNIFEAVHNWKNYSNKMAYAGGELNVSFLCSKNYEGLPFQRLSIAFSPANLVWTSDIKIWEKEGTDREHIIKDAVLERLKERVKTYLNKIK